MNEMSALWCSLSAAFLGEIVYNLTKIENSSFIFAGLITVVDSLQSTFVKTLHKKCNLQIIGINLLDKA